MIPKTIDVYIYIPAKGKDNGVSTVIDAVGKISGVVQARLNQHVKRLVSVKYDPAHVSGQVILDAVKHKGNLASLIGM
jgi:hypothetical protein